MTFAKLILTSHLTSNIRYAGYCIEKPRIVYEKIILFSPKTLGIIHFLMRAGIAVPIACLSNTNELHWPVQKDAEYLNCIFDKMFLSYKMGMVKPDLEIYDSMINAIDLSPSNILFIDDNEINVDTAKQAGLTAATAKGINEVNLVLQNYDCIS